jgi:Icc-related predicted phosphoesterase
MPEPIRVAAVGDVHLADDLRGRYAPLLDGISAEADALLVAGDLTQHGTIDEARAFADEFDAADVPVLTVLGNHDYHSGEEREIAQLLEERGMTVLEGTSTTIETRAGRLGVAGVKGFCLGFSGRSAADFGEPQMKAFTGHGIETAVVLRRALDDLAGEDPDVTVALSHFAPVDDTLLGEPKEIWPFLGNYRLGEAIDETGVDLAVHGHAHAGREKGLTPAGVPVRNVAQPVIQAAFRVYDVVPRRSA